MRLPIRALGRPCLSQRSASLTLSSGRRHLTNNGFFRVSEEVRAALDAKKPVVALETTIYTHGFPYPDNVALASLLESVVRVNGGVPATIGVLDGVARVGMSAEELIRLTESAGKQDTLKLSRRDLSYVCGMRLAGKNFNGGTTIAGTMLLAQLAGIKVFGTGGLGGVHRGAESTMDISADLTELGRTPVTVISSGCKSFLDIPRTLEYLETEGVLVGTFADGRPGNVDFPAFWSRDSGVKSPTTIQNEIEAAAIIHAQHSLNISSGLHFASPVPLEAAIPKDTMDSVIEEAIRQADASGASGKDNTPFILNKIKELTKGKSIPANRALIESNVKRAAIVARELAIIEAKQEQAQGHAPTYFESSSVSYSPPPPPALNSLSPVQTSSSITIAPSPPEVIVAGSLAVDFSCDYAPISGSADQKNPSPHTSNPAVIRQTLGGVGQNIARALHYLGASVQLCSAVGDDLLGKSALSQLEANGMRTDGIQTLESGRTAQYVAVNNAEKDLQVAMADMALLESIPPQTITSTWLKTLAPTHANPPKYLVVDACWTPSSLRTWLEFSRITQTKVTTIFEPVSTAKSTRIFPAAERAFPNHLIDIATPNSYELTALHNHALEHGLFESPDWFRIIDALGIPSSGLRVPLAYTTTGALVDQGIPQQAIKLLPFIPTILTKLGPDGVLLTQLLQRDDLVLSSADEAPYVLARNSNGDAGSGVGGLYVRLYRPERVLREGEVVSVNGIGDTFVGALVAGLVQGGLVRDVIPFAQRAAGLSLRSGEAVSLELRGLRGELVGR